MTGQFSIRSTLVPGESKMSAFAFEDMDKLERLCGSGPLKDKVCVARERLSRVRERYWHTPQAKGRIKRFLYGEQIPNTEEIDDIRAAFARLCPDLIEKNRQENAALLQHIVSYAQNAAALDPEHYRSRVAPLLARLLQSGRGESTDVS